MKHTYRIDMRAGNIGSNKVVARQIEYVSARTPLGALVRGWIPAYLNLRDATNKPLLGFTVSLEAA